jgi:hypothetical protein
MTKEAEGGDRGRMKLEFPSNPFTFKDSKKKKSEKRVFKKVYRRE